MALLDLATLHAPFANGGKRVAPYLISEIKTATGKVLFRRKADVGTPIIAPGPLAAMNDVHAEVLRSGTGRSARIDRPAGGKTGTTQGLRDAVFVGYTADLVTAVWFGNDDNSPMRKITGATLPARAWGGFMRTAHAGLPVRPIPGAGHRALPTTVALPTFRPTGTVRPVLQASLKVDESESLRERMTRLVRERANSAATEVARRSITDLILGR
ncbi:MAG: penicillin-binding transpeptidase domain-containing protein, partial [Pseudomonadota bacterium]